MKAGFSEIDITPQVLGKLGRLIAVPTQVESVHSRLYARLSVFADGERRVAILGLDMNFMFRENVPVIREVIAAAGGMAPEDVMVTCTHTHNSFPTTPWHAEDGASYEGLDYLLGFLPTLTGAAVAGMQTCQLRSASVAVPGLTLNRRSCYTGDDGRIHVATHGPHDDPTFVGVEGPTDDEVKILLAVTPAGETLGGIVNVAMHPTTMFSQPVYSSSYIGPLVEALKARFGGTFAFLYGVSGDLCSAQPGNGDELNRSVGERIAAMAVAAAEQAQPVAGDAVRMSRVVIDMPLRRPTTEQVTAAKRYQKMDPADVDQRELCMALYGHPFIFYGKSARHVQVFTDEMIGTWEYQRRAAERELTREQEVQVIALGELAIVGFSSELFCQVKHDLQAASPFAQTMFATMANGGNGYLPPVASHKNGGYETCLGVASQFAEDASERMQAAAQTQLADLAAAQPKAR